MVTIHELISNFLKLQSNKAFRRLKLYLA